MKNYRKNSFFFEKQGEKDLMLDKDPGFECLDEGIFSIGEEKTGGKQEFLGSYFDRRKMKGIFLFFIFGFLILLAKLFYLQVALGADYRDSAEKNRLRISIMRANRGIIYDKNNIPLVQNIPSYILTLTPYNMPKKDEARRDVVLGLAKILNKSEAGINEILQKYSPSYPLPVVIADDLGPEEVIKTQILLPDLIGADLELVAKRKYMFDGVNSLSHLIGYTGLVTQTDVEKNSENEYKTTDYIGKSGLEYAREGILRGKNGKKQVEVDALGREKNIIAMEEAVNGKDIVLSIDINLQKKVQEIFKKYLALYHKNRGAIVMMDPNNGEIIAMVSLPDFDSNSFTGGMSQADYEKIFNNPAEPLFNRAVSGEYPSGSTIKPIIAAAALQTGIINAATSFLSTGGIWYDKWFFPDWKAGGHGVINVMQALAESVNTFFYIIGGGLAEDKERGYRKFDGLGVDRMVQFAGLFGLGKKLGIDLPNEGAGLLPTPEWKKEVKKQDWYIGDTYHMAIGQGDVLATPLQITNMIAFFANGGTLYLPRLTKEIIDQQAGKNMKVDPVILNKNFISRDNIEIVRRGLRQTVISGSAKSLADTVVHVAGKTGTAQWVTGKESHAWFVGFAPYEKPTVAISVLIEEGGEGSAVSVPVAKEILNWYFSQK